MMIDDRIEALRQRINVFFVVGTYPGSADDSVNQAFGQKRYSHVSTTQSAEELRADLTRGVLPFAEVDIRVCRNEFNCRCIEDATTGYGTCSLCGKTCTTVTSYGGPVRCAKGCNQ